MICDEGAINLVSAIINRARMDYISSAVRLKKCPADKKALKTKLNVTSFIGSNWFDTLICRQQKSFVIPQWNKEVKEIELEKV